MSYEDRVMPVETVHDTVPDEVSPLMGKGALGE